MKILLVEDEPDIATPLLYGLRANGYTVMHAHSLEAAHSMFSSQEPDSVVLDVGLPEDKDGGFIFAEHIRAAGFTGGILFLTARNFLKERIRGLDSGGDDYLAKPFEIAEVLSRLRAVSRRNSEIRTSNLAYSDLKINLIERQVSWKNNLVELTEAEYLLLERMAMSPTRVFSTQSLLNLFWAEANNPGIVKVYIYRLRQKFCPAIIETVSMGYRFGLN